MNRLVRFGYLLLALSLWVYSYGFVDFNLTLSAHPAVMAFVHMSQSLAMFARDRSTLVYLILTTSAWGLYTLVLSDRLATFRRPLDWRWLMSLSLVCALAYPMLSADVFKYLFAGKEVLVYHANPHLVAPQVFADDTWLRFMRWIHTPSPYGPVMTALGMLAYILGMGKFTVTLFVYKLMQWGWYLLAIWLVQKYTRSPRAGWLLALHPLILIEWLLNGHNDAAMLTLALLALVLERQGRRLGAWITLLLSVGIKYVTGVFAPLLLVSRGKWQRPLRYATLAALFLAPLLYHYSYQYQPWYVTWLIPLAIIWGNQVLQTAVMAYSVGALLRYLPYIATGLWQGTASSFALLTFGPLGLYLLGYVLVWLWRSRGKQTQ